MFTGLVKAIALSANITYKDILKGRGEARSLSANNGDVFQESELLGMAKENFTVFVDGDKYEWGNSTISGSELRTLAAIPENAQIFLKVPGKPDEPINSDTIVDLAKHHGPPRFSTQSPGSQAG